MFQFLCCLNCAVAIILVIDSARFSIAPFFGRSRLLDPLREQSRGAEPPANPEPVADSEVQFRINAYLKLGRKLRHVKDWDYLKTSLNIKHIIVCPVQAGGEKKQRALLFQAEFQKKGFCVTLAKALDCENTYQGTLCKSEPSGRKLMIHSNARFIRKVYLESVCAVALSDEFFLKNFKLCKYHYNAHK